MMLRGGCCVRRDLGRQRERAVLALVIPACSRRTEHTRYGTQGHLPWTTECPQGKVPVKSGPGHPFAFQAQNQHPSLKLDGATSTSEHGHKQESKPSKGIQTSLREAAPSLGSSMEPHSPGLPTPAPLGLFTRAGEVLAASSSQRTGAGAGLPPLLWNSRHSPSPANEPRAPA